MRRERGRYKSLEWLMVPCASRKAMRRTDSQKGIEEILSSKLATILEEPDYEKFGKGNNATSHRNISRKNNSSNNSNNSNNRLLWLKGRKKEKDLIRSKFKKSRALLVSHNLCIKGSYVTFLAGFVATGSLTRLPCCNS